MWHFMSTCRIITRCMFKMITKQYYITINSTNERRKLYLTAQCYIMKKKFLSHVLLLSLAFFAACTPFNVQAAANDDPGAGRLSGTDVPKEFYEDANPSEDGISTLRRYGTFQTLSPYTNVTYDHQDQFAGIPIVNGIDVSEYQKTIDWAAVKASGIDYAFIRVGGRGWGASGGMYNDSNYAANMQNAIAAGVNVGIYIFSQATTPAEAEEEAQFILDRIGTYNVTMPLILDYEFASGSSNGGRLRNANLSKEDATNVCLAFCKKITTAGYTPMVYANPDMLNNHLNASVISNSYPLWLANYTTNTTYNGVFTYWQYSSAGTVPGIDGKVDMNFYYNAPANCISRAVIPAIDKQNYTEVAITPAVSVIQDRIPLVANQDYTVQYANNVLPGTASITITGINNYYGTRTVTFDIASNVPAMSGITITGRTKNSITLGWTADANAAGYEIYRSNTANGPYEKIITVANSSTTGYTDDNLSSGECYYYQMRMYVINNGNTFYGDYSPVVSSYTKSQYVQMALPKYAVTVYAGATVASNPIGTVKKNVAMQILYRTYDEAGNRWYCVSSDYGNVFVPGYQVKVGKRGKIKTSRVNVRKSRSILSKRLTRLNKNKTVTVLSSKRKHGIKWYKVCFKKGSKTYNGYISSAYVKLK